jgi:hypothetical protein
VETLRRFHTKLVESPICQHSIAVVGYGRACIKGHLVCEDRSAERQVAPTQGDEMYKEVAPMQAATRTERLKIWPLCRDEITDQIGHLGGQVSELVWFDCSLKCGVKLTVDGVKSGKRAAVCGNRQVRCP